MSGLMSELGLGMLGFGDPPNDHGNGPTANKSLTMGQMGQILNQAKKRALEMLKAPKCNTAFGGSGFGAERINQTRYSIRPASAFSDPTAWMEMVSPVSVKVNSQGGFFTSSVGQVSLMFGDPITLSGDMLRGFVLLHELAHQLNGTTGVPNDGGSAAASAMVNQFVYDNCVAP